MSFRMLIIGDLHFKNSNPEITDCLHAETLRVIKTYSPKYVLMTGDLLNDHEKISSAALRRVIAYFEAIISTGVELFLLIGNHDFVNNKVYMTNEHPFNALKLWPRTHVIDRCVPFERDGIHFTCCCYIPNGRFLEALTDCAIDISTMDVIFSHSEFTNCKINKVSKSSCDIWPENYPCNIAGHIHDFEVVQSNLIYVGTPYQQTFSERDDKGIHLLTFNEKEPILEKILCNIPKKIYLHVHYEDLYDVKIPKGDVKVKISGPTAEVKKLMQTPMLREKFAGVKVTYAETSSKVIPTLSIPQCPFATRLRQKIAEKVALKKVFDEIFP